MMNIQTVSDIYDGNEKAHEKFIAFVASMREQARHAAHGANWSVAQLVEHVALVEDSMSRICAKLLGKAEAESRMSDGSVEISPEFIAKSGEIVRVKLEAPERVRPIGERSIAESLALMEESRQRFEQLRPSFEKYDSRVNKFPHPYFGDISAAEWLILAGGHKARHLRQLRKLVENGESPAELEG